MRRSLAFALLPCVLALALARAGEEEEARSPRPRATPDVPAADLQARARGSVDLGLDLLRRLPRDADAILSPHSIAQALLMAHAGARGETATQMAQALRVEGALEEALAAQNALDQALGARGKNAQGRSGQPFRLRSVQAAWAQRGHPFLPEYLDLLATHFGAGVRLADFEADPDAVASDANAWVERLTEGKVPALIARGALSRDTRLVLANAVSFDAAWERRFEPGRTALAPFTVEGMSPVQVPTMWVEAQLARAEHQGIRAIELPYSGGEVSMLVLLPERGRALETMVQDLTAARVQDIVGTLQGGRVSVSMPKFTVRSHAELAPLLSAAGMPAAFSDDADLSGMDGGRELRVTAVIHEAFADVDEDGTEAAAATAVSVGVTSVAPPPERFAIDRSFVFLIRDRATGAALFVGKVIDPR